MEYRALGRSGLKVSTLTLGTMTFGGDGGFARIGETSVKDAARQIDMCLEAGVNMLDTADLYSYGQSEEIIGEILPKDGRRNRLLLASKVRFPMSKEPNDAGLSRHHIMKSCEASLKRLRTDFLDIYWCHEWDGVTPVC